MERKSNLRAEIDYSTVDNIRSFIPSYDKEADSLMLQLPMQTPAISVDFDGDFWVRIHPESGGIVGIEIEDYKAFFHKKYSVLLKGKGVTDPIIKELIISLLKLGSKPYTRKTFMRDLGRVCQRATA